MARSERQLSTLKPKGEDLVLLDARIRTVRGGAVILDSDLASVYGVLTKALNQAVKRNRERFPEDFLFQVSVEEFASLRSQSVTSSAG